MQALQLIAPQSFEYVELPDPVPAPGEVVVRIEQLAVCGSDLRFYDRILERYPHPAGHPCHECVGTVETSTVPEFRPGERVLALTDTGGLVEKLAVTPDLLVRLPDPGSVPDSTPDLWVLCQPMGTVIYAMQRLGSVLGKTVAVIGSGPIGLCFTDLLVRHGAAQVIVTDLHDYRLAAARALGATHTINAAREDAVARIGEITGGRMVDVSIEAVGLPEAFTDCFAAVRKLGTVVIFGVPHLEGSWTFDWQAAYDKVPTVVVANSVISGARSQAVATCVDLVAQGRLDLSYLVTHRFGWDEVPLAFSTYSAGKSAALKGIVTVG